MTNFDTWILSNFIFSRFIYWPQIYRHWAKGCGLRGLVKHWKQVQEQVLEGL